MNRRTNIINNIILLAATLVGILAVTLVGNDAYGGDIWSYILYCLIGAVVWALVNTLVHEWGHIRAGKKNKFRFISMRVAFLLFRKEKGKIRLDFTGFSDELGSTEMVPENTENLSERFVKMTRGGLIGNIVLLIISLVPLFLTSFLPIWLYAIWAIMLPVSVYFVLGNGLPMSSDGIKNDAAVALGVKRGDDSEKVMLSLLCVHALLTEGKRPRDIEERYYVDVPQLPEDDLNYLLLLDARYVYYLDKEDYEKAKDVSARLECMLNDMPKSYRPYVRANLLYNACTFAFDEAEADNLVEDNERYLNNVNDVTVLRIKSSYVLYVLKDYAQARKFLTHAEEKLDTVPVEGLRIFEESLITRMLADLPAEEEKDGEEETVGLKATNDAEETNKEN